VCYAAARFRASAENRAHPVAPQPAAPGPSGRIAVTGGGSVMREWRNWQTRRI
jgi:hypothetical protein